MQEGNLLNRSLQKLRALVKELQSSNVTLQSEHRRTRDELTALQGQHRRLQLKEKRLQRMVHKMEILLNNSHQGYILIDRQRRVVSFNEMSSEVTQMLYGVELQERRNFYDYVPADLVSLINETLANGFDGIPTIRERKMPEVFGDRWFRVRYDPVTEEDGSVEYVLLSYIELTDEVTLRKELEEKKRLALETQQLTVENEANLKAIINNTTAFIYSLDRQYRYITFNAPLAYQMKAIYGVDLKKGENALEVINPAEAAEYKLQYDRAFNGERIQFTKVVDVNGDSHHIEFTFTPIQTDSGIIGVSCYVFDVSERARAVQMLQQSETRFRSLVEHGGDMITMLDAQGNIRYQSASLKRILGYDEAELTQTSAFDLIHPDDLHKASRYLETTLAQPGVPVPCVLRSRCKDGSFLTTEGFVTNMLHVDGVNALVTNFRDVTERVRAEQNYREIFDKATDAIFVHDIETGAVLDVNQTAVTITGFTRDELINGQQLLCTDEPGYSIYDAQRWMQKAITEGPQTFEWLGQGKYGSRHWTEVNITRANIAGTDRLLAFFRDINERKAIEKHLEKSIQNLQNSARRQSEILDALPANIALLDRSGTIVAANKRWNTFSQQNGGESDAAYVGTNYIEVCERDESGDGRTVADGLQKVVNGSLATFTHEYTCHAPDQKRWFRVEITPLNTQACSGVVVMHIDISDRKLKEEALRASNELYDLISKATNDAIWDWDIASNKTQWSAGYQKLFGYDLAETGNSTTSALRIHPDDRERVLASINENLRSKCRTGWECEYRYLRADGEIAHVQDRAYVVYNEQNEPLRMVGVMQDITDRKQKEEALLRSNELHDLISKATNDAIWDLNLKTQELYWNGNYTKLFGYSSSEESMTLANWESHVHQDDKERISASLQDAIDNRLTFWENEYRYIRADGSVASVYDRGYILFDANDLPYRMVGTMQDITERVRNIEQIKQNEAQLRASQQVAHIGSWQLETVLDDTLRNRVSWSDEMFRIFGFEPQSFQPSYELFMQLVHPDDLPKVKSYVEPAFTEQRDLDYETRIVKPDGSIRHIHVRADIAYDASGKPLNVAGTVQDITQRVEREAQLRASNELYNLVSKATNDSVWDLNLQTDEFTWSEAYQKQYGYPSSKQNVVDNWLRHIHIEDRERVNTSFTSAIDNHNPFWEEEYRYHRANGELVYVHDRGYLMYDDCGKPMRMVGAMQDITERKLSELEREKLTNELVEKNKGLEQFAYIVSHNLRAPVANIVGLSTLLKRDTIEEKKKSEMLEMLHKSVGKLDNVIRDLNTTLQIKNATVEKHESVLLQSVIDDILTSLDQTIKKENALVETNFEVEQLNTIKTYLYSVLQNLITNSLKYRKPNEQPVIRIESKSVDNQIVITYKDNGLGMNLEKVGDKVFGMYKRFHSHVEGKGMGLFMVKTQVETLGGKIRIDSKLNEGTTFTITLPQ